MHKNIKSIWNMKFAENIPIGFNIEVGAGECVLKLGEINATTLEMELGAGNLEVDCSGKPALRELEIDSGAGDVAINLNGVWENDLKGVINAGVGSVTVKVPREVSVKATIDAGVGKVNAEGFEKQEKTYVNTPPGARATLTLGIDCGVGDVNLVFAD